MAHATDERMQRVVAQLQQDPSLMDHLPEQVRAIVRAALEGQSVYEIAQQQQLSEAAVWSYLSNAARAAGGQPVPQQAESGGLGSDTDPGVTGGYGDTGFGSLGNEPPEPISEEPDPESSH